MLRKNQKDKNNENDKNVEELSFKILEKLERRLSWVLWRDTDEYEKIVCIKRIYIFPVRKNSLT